MSVSSSHSFQVVFIQSELEESRDDRDQGKKGSDIKGRLWTDRFPQQGADRGRWQGKNAQAGVNQSKPRTPQPFWQGFAQQGLISRG